MTCQELNAAAAKCRLDILRMIWNAGSGHPGGALSSADMLVSLFSEYPDDLILVSHGHIAAALYAVLGNFGYFPVENAVWGFRRGSIFEGHPNIDVPGVEWCSGALGQGLSVGAGLAVGERIAGSRRHVWVVMGDGEQDKGQIHEARMTASKFRLSGLTALIDANGLQASGSAGDILNVDIAESFRMAGWKVFEVDGHSFPGLLKVLEQCRNEEAPSVVIAHTVMGKGVPEIENNFEYHGKLLPEAAYCSAVKRLAKAAVGFKTPLPRMVHKTLAKSVRELPPFKEFAKAESCRSAFGETLAEISKLNPGCIAAVDCDLRASVKLDSFAKISPENFFECGITENNAASFAAGLSRAVQGTFFADFGVFGMTEVLSQLRMADFNRTSMKIVCTHCGADVGEDGKTHQSVDYLALAGTLRSFKVLVPADANQCEHMIRYAAENQGNFFILMGRSKLPEITDHGHLCFGTKYRLEYGKADILRYSPADHACIVTFGTFAHQAVELSDAFAAEGLGISVVSVGSPLEFDEAAFRLAAGTGFVAVWEDHNAGNGLGARLAAWYFEHGIFCGFHRFGLTKPGISASPEEQWIYQKISKRQVGEYLRKYLRKRNKTC